MSENCFSTYNTPRFVRGGISLDITQVGFRVKKDLFFKDTARSKLESTRREKTRKSSKRKDSVGNVSKNERAWQKAKKEIGVCNTERGKIIRLHQSEVEDLVLQPATLKRSNSIADQNNGPKDNLKL